MKTGVLILILVGVVSVGYSQCRDEAAVEQALLNYLPCTFLGGSVKGCCLPFDKDVYSEKSRQRLLTILNREIKHDEYIWFAERKYIMRVENSLETVEGILQYPKSKTTQKDRARFSAMRDSLRKDLVVRDTKVFDEILEQVKNARVSDEVIYLSGFLKDKRFIPALEAAVNDSIHFNTSSVRLALARQRVEPFYTQLLTKLGLIVSDLLTDTTLNSNRYSNIVDSYRPVARKLLYMATPASIEIYCSFLDFEYYLPPPDFDVYYPSLHALVINNLRGVIMNEEFQRYFEEKDINSDELTLKDIDWLKKWLVNNKGKLSYDFTH